MRPTEGVRQRWGSRGETRAGRKAVVQARWSRNMGVCATGSGILGDCERAIVLHQFFGTCLKNDAVVVNAVSAAQKSLAFPKQVVDKSYAGSKILLVRGL